MLTILTSSLMERKAKESKGLGAVRKGENLVRILSKYLDCLGLVSSPTDCLEGRHSGGRLTGIVKIA